jgi:hypothetical protein
VVSQKGRFAALLYLKRRNDEFLVLDGDTHALSGLETSGLDPSSGELHPRKGRRLLAQMHEHILHFTGKPSSPIPTGWEIYF